MDLDNPPFGMPWVLWMLLAFVGGPAGVAGILSEAAAALPGVFGAAARWRQRRRVERLEALTNPPSAQIDDAEIARLARRYDQLAADAERDRADHRAEMDEVRAEVAALRDSLTVANSRLWAAIGYVRVLVDAIRRIDPDHPIPDPPDKLRDLI
ncbi:MAG: hypothetical protein QM582_14490 [Micropruina sp.]|uniref:hypothetical protein n=1 Tax=Micropruina sp. TaxID=2737536 RepID=UPI0039E647FD